MTPRPPKRCDFSTGYTPGCPFEKEFVHNQPAKMSRADLAAHVAFYVALAFIAWGIAGFFGA